MMYVLLVAILIAFNVVSADNMNNECTIRKAVDLNFPDIDGAYYLMLYVNETNMDQRTSCIKITFRTDQSNHTIHETVEMIRNGDNNVTTTYLNSHYKRPGILQNEGVINGTTITFLDYMMEFTKGQSLISSVCQKNDGIKHTDKIAVFFTTRNVSPDAMLKKLRSVEISGSEPNTDYYFVPQLKCPN